MLGPVASPSRLMPRSADRIQSGCLMTTYNDTAELMPGLIPSQSDRAGRMVVPILSRCRRRARLMKLSVSSRQCMASTNVQIWLRVLICFACDCSCFGGMHVAQWWCRYLWVDAFLWHSLGIGAYVGIYLTISLKIKNQCVTVSVTIQSCQFWQLGKSHHQLFFVTLFILLFDFRCFWIVVYCVIIFIIYISRLIV